MAGLNSGVRSVRTYKPTVVISSFFECAAYAEQNVQFLRIHCGDDFIDFNDVTRVESIQRQRVNQVAEVNRCNIGRISGLNQGTYRNRVPKSV